MEKKNSSVRSAFDKSDSPYEFPANDEEYWKKKNIFCPNYIFTLQTELEKLYVCNYKRREYFYM